MDIRRSGLIKKIVNIVLNFFITIFCIILIISIYNNLQVTVLKNSYASFFGYSIFEVQTGSMEPAINAGDCVIVKFANEYNLDDIVTFEKNGEFITHRVIEAYKGTYVTEGDANNAKDDPISREQIVGKVVKILPNIGMLRSTMMNPGVLVALIITFYLISLVFKDRKNKKEEKEMSSYIMNLVEKIKKIKNIFKRKEKVRDTIVPEGREIIESRIEKIESQADYIEIEENPSTLEAEPIPSSSISVEEETVEEQPVEKENTYHEDDLDKTMYFRMISVDDEEPVIENIIEEEPEEKPIKKEKIKEEKQKENDNPEETIVKELENIQKKRKKFKNIIEKAMFIKEEEFIKIIDIVLGEEKNKSNIATIKTTLVKTYIDAKYYNYCGNVNVEYNKKNMTSKLNMAIKTKTENMLNSYKGSDKKYGEKVLKVSEIIVLILYLEQEFLVKEGIRVKRENYKNRMLKMKENALYEGPILNTMVNEIIEVQKLHSAMIKTSIQKLDTNTFKLVSNQISKNITGVYLEHNIAFSKVYSDYIVDKTYQEGVIAEDKIAVLIMLLSREILNDMLNQEFNQKYLIYIPESLYAKSNKLGSIFDKFEDEYAKTCTIILVQYEELSRNTKVIRSLIKEGYKFAVDLSKTDKIKSKDMGVMELMSSIFINKKTKEKKAMLGALSKEANSRVVTDDIEAKIGSFWG